MRANQPDFTVLISGSYDASIRCWDTRSRSQEPIQILNEAKDSVSSLEISENAIISGLVCEFNSCAVVLVCFILFLQQDPVIYMASNIHKGTKYALCSLQRHTLI